jgi:hypothetical protein
MVPFPVLFSAAVAVKFSILNVIVPDSEKKGEMSKIWSSMISTPSPSHQVMFGGVGVAWAEHVRVTGSPTMTVAFSGFIINMGIPVKRYVICKSIKRFIKIVRGITRVHAPSSQSASNSNASLLS